MVGNKKLIDITMEFPNSACDIKNLNAIGNGKKDLIKLADEAGLTDSRSLEDYAQFIKKYSDAIDLRKYLLFQYYNYENTDLNMNKINKAKAQIRELLSGEPNTTVYFLEERDGLLDIDEHSIYEIFGKKEPKKDIETKYEKIFEDRKLFMDLAGILMLSDLKKILPKNLAEQISFKSISNAMTKSLDIESATEDNQEYRLNVTKEVISSLEKFKDKIDIEKWLLIAGYRFKSSLEKHYHNEKISEDEIRIINYYYNRLAQISSLLGDSKKVKFKGKLENGTDQFEHVSISARDLGMSVANLRKKVTPNNFELQEDSLKGLEESDISLNKLFKKVKEPQELLGDDESVEIGKLDKYRVNFISPDEKKKIFYAYEEKPIAYRGTKGKAYEGYGVFIYPKKKFAMLECFFKKDKDGKKKFAYDTATVIVPIEKLEDVLKSREKLEKIPLAKELKVPSGEKAETVKYAEHERLERNVKHKRIEQRRPIRIYHTANWKKRIDGILSGKVNPFLISIVASGKKRTKEKAKQDKEKEFVQNMSK